VPYKNREIKNRRSREWYQTHPKYWLALTRKLPKVKHCSTCKEIKPALAFSFNRRNADGLQGRCRQCANRAAKAWRETNPDRHRRANTLWARKSRLSKKYGITQAIYEQMTAEQKGLCAACGKPPISIKHRTDDAWRLLYVDHDHATGKVRGLLCRKCNLLLGWLEKNAEQVRALNRYLCIVIG